MDANFVSMAFYLEIICVVAAENLSCVLYFVTNVWYNRENEKT